MDLFFDVKFDVNKALEEARGDKIIGSSLEANVILNLPEKYNKVKENLEECLHQLLIVSKVIYTDEKIPTYENVGVKIEKSTGKKCNRCWNYVDELVEDRCLRCDSILKGNK